MNGQNSEGNQEKHGSTRYADNNGGSREWTSESDNKMEFEEEDVSCLASLIDV